MRQFIELFIAVKNWKKTLSVVLCVIGLKDAFPVYWKFRPKLKTEGNNNSTCEFICLPKRF